MSDKKIEQAKADIARWIAALGLDERSTKEFLRDVANALLSDHNKPTNQVSEAEIMCEIARVAVDEDPSLPQDELRETALERLGLKPDYVGARGA